MSKTCTLLTVLLTGNILYAQQNDSTRLDDVVVTATRTGIKSSQTGKIVTVIDQAAINRQQGRSLGELLNTQAGFFINGSNNSLGTNQDLYFRGAGTGSMLVVIDGTPVFDPSQTNNAFDLNSISLDQVEKIEILRGGQSTLWGSDAVAGVVQVFLKKGSRAKPSINAQAAYGSYETFRSNAALSGQTGALGYNVRYGYTKSAGMPAAYDSTGTKNFRKNGFEQSTLFTELRYQIRPGFSLRTFSDLSHYNTSYAGGPFTDEKDYNARNKNYVGGLALQYQRNQFTWSLTGSIQQVRRKFVNDSGYVSSIYSKYSEGYYTGRTTVLESFANQRWGKHFQLTGGIQHISQNTSQSYFSTGAFGPFATALGKDSANIQQTSVFVSALFSGWKGWNLELGTRLNHHSIYGTNATYTINPSFTISERTKFFVNISSAYKIPSLYQLYSEYGNKQLRPEYSTTYEAGVQTHNPAQTWSVRLAVFKRDVRDIIIFYTDPATFNSQYINRSQQRDWGGELETKFSLGKKVQWLTNLAYVDGKGIDKGVKTKNLYRRPHVVINSSLNIQASQSLHISPSIRFVGSRLKGEYDAGPAEQPSYYTIDLLANYDITTSIRAFIDLRNITNQRYFDVVGYNSKRFNMMAGFSVRL